MPSQEVLAIFELSQQQVRLAGATKPCPESWEPHHEYQSWTCLTCNGTGRVYLFPIEVRVACPRTQLPDGQYFAPGQGHRGMYNYNASEHRPPAMKEFVHAKCQGLGWTPNLDARAWEKAFTRVLIVADASWDVMGEWYKTDDPEDAFFAAGCRFVEDHPEWELGPE